MAQIQSILSSIPPGAELLGVGALLAFGTKSKTVQWIAFGVGGLTLLLSMQKTSV